MYNVHMDWGRGNVIVYCMKCHVCSLSVPQSKEKKYALKNARIG